MRGITPSRVVLTTAFVIGLSTAPLVGQTTDPTVLSALQKSLLAMSGSTTVGQVKDVTITSDAQSIVGSDAALGTANLKAGSDRSSRIDISLSSGSRSEFRGLIASGPAAFWSGTDGTTHPVAYSNLFSENVWFFPLLVLTKISDSSNFYVSYLGQETRNGIGVLHFSYWQRKSVQFDNDSTDLRRLTQTDLYLDQSTFLPQALVFNVHPDDDSNVDIPIEIQYSSYQSTNGLRIPFQIRKLVNNSPSLDLHLASVAFNTGFSSGSLQLQ